MSKSTTLTTRIDAKLEDDLNRLAEAKGRTKSWLVNEALRSYVATERQFIAAVKEGRRALKDGRVIDHSTVAAAFDRITSPGA
jgi:predicted transcriptional regulator